jgi:hypothetical protein
MRTRDSSYVPLAEKFFLGLSRVRHSKEVPMWGYDALVADCTVFEFHGGPDARFSVLVQIDDEWEEVDWVSLPADAAPAHIEAASIGHFTLHHDTLRCEAIRKYSDTRVRLRYETGPTTGVMFSSGIDRRR